MSDFGRSQAGVVWPPPRQHRSGLAAAPRSHSPPVEKQRKTPSFSPSHLKISCFLWQHLSGSVGRPRAFVLYSLLLNWIHSGRAVCFFFLEYEKQEDW